MTCGIAVERDSGGWQLFFTPSSSPQQSSVCGRASMSVQQRLQLGSGSILELDRKVGEAIDIYVNNRLVARGEVVIVDERLGVTMTEIIKDGDAAA